MEKLEFYVLKILNQTQVLPDGTVYEIKQLLGRINSLKIEMYFNDHDPPHFHVKTNCGSIDATFKLEDCSLINGQIGSKDIKRVEYFYGQNKTQLWDFWNEKVIKQNR